MGAGANRHDHSRKMITGGPGRTVIAGLSALGRRSSPHVEAATVATAFTRVVEQTSKKLTEK